MNGIAINTLLISLGLVAALFCSTGSSGGWPHGPIAAATRLTALCFASWGARLAYW